MSRNVIISLVWTWKCRIHTNIVDRNLLGLTANGKIYNTWEDNIRRKLCSCEEDQVYVFGRPIMSVELRYCSAEDWMSITDKIYVL
jgi:hypothetical protein